MGLIDINFDISYFSDVVFMLCYFEVGGMVCCVFLVVKKCSGNYEYIICEFRFIGSGIKFGLLLKDFSGIFFGMLCYIGLVMVEGIVE